jgi:hypothetical protein
MMSGAVRDATRCARGCEASRAASGWRRWRAGVAALAALITLAADPEAAAQAPPAPDQADKAQAPKPPRWRRMSLPAFGVSLELHPRMVIKTQTDDLFIAVGSHTGFTVMVVPIPGSNHLTFEDMLWPLRALTDLQVIDYETFAPRKFPYGVRGQSLLCRVRIAGELMKVGAVAVPWPEINRTAIVYTLYRPNTGNDGTERRTLNSIQLNR